MANMHLVTGYAGTEHVTAADAGSLNSAIFGTGEYVLDRGNKFAATVVTNNTIRIADGDLMMQGRHVRLTEGDYVDLAIDNGAQGMLRNDLIVARYTKNASTGVEEVNLVVIKGTAAASNPSDPAYTSGDIINNHVILNDMPLYRVPLNGINVQALVPLFKEYTNDDVYTKEQTDSLLAKKANSSHKHSISDVNGLQEALDSATPKAHTHELSEVNGLQTALNAKAPMYTYSATDIAAGSTALETGKLYFVYE